MGSSTLKSRFVLTGRFVRFAIEDGFKIKGFYLDTGAEELLVKVPKRLRYYCADLLVPGAFLRVAGKKSVKLKTDRIKYKAEDVLPLSPSAVVQDAGNAVVEQREVASSMVAVEGAVVGNSKSRGLPTKASAKPACIRVCQKSSCRKRGGSAVWAALEAEIGDRGLGDRVKLKGTGCMDKCKAGPNIVMPGKMRYSRVKTKSISDLMDEHFPTESSFNS